MPDQIIDTYQQILNGSSPREDPFVPSRGNAGISDSEGLLNQIESSIPSRAIPSPQVSTDSADTYSQIMQPSAPVVQEPAPTPAVPPSRGLMDWPKEFLKGMASGAIGMGETAGGLLEMAGATDTGKSIIKASQEAAAPFQAAVPNWRDIDGITNALLYASHLGGSVIPTIAMTLIPGGLAAKGAQAISKARIGAGLAEAAGGALSKGALDTAIKLTPELAKRVATAASKGYMTGGFLGSLAMESGSIAAEQSGQPEGVDTLRALTFATPAALLDFLPGWSFVKRMGLFGNKTLKEVAEHTPSKIAGWFDKTVPRRVLREAATQFAQEAPTEGAQAIFERWGARGDAFDKEGIDNIINNFIGGGIGGALFGGAGGLFTKGTKLSKQDFTQKGKTTEITEDMITASIPGESKTTEKVSPYFNEMANIEGEGVNAPLETDNLPSNVEAWFKEYNKGLEMFNGINSNPDQGILDLHTKNGSWLRLEFNEGTGKYEVKGVYGNADGTVMTEYPADPDKTKIIPVRTGNDFKQLVFDFVNDNPQVTTSKPVDALQSRTIPVEEKLVKAQEQAIPVKGTESENITQPTNVDAIVQQVKVDAEAALTKEVPVTVGKTPPRDAIQPATIEGLGPLGTGDSIAYQGEEGWIFEEFNKEDGKVVISKKGDGGSIREVLPGAITKSDPETNKYGVSNYTVSKELSQFSMDGDTWKPGKPRPTTGYQVGDGRNSLKNADLPSVGKWWKRVREIITTQPDMYYGGYRSDESGTHFMDVSQHVTSMEEAMRLATERGAESIWDNKNKRTIRVSDNQLRSSIQSTFNTTYEQAEAVIAIMHAIGIDPNRLIIGSNSLPKGTILEQAHRIYDKDFRNVERFIKMGKDLIGEDLPGLRLKPVPNVISSIAKQLVGKLKPIIPKNITMMSDAAIVKAIVKATNLELDAWTKWMDRHGKEYVGFYDVDVKKANDDLQRWAVENHGRQLTPAEIDLFHMLSSLSASGVSPDNDSSSGLLILNNYLSDRKSHPLRKPRLTNDMYIDPEGIKKKKNDKGQLIPVIDPATGQPVKGTEMAMYFDSSGFSRLAKTLDYFSGDLDAAMNWIKTEHPLSEIEQVTGITIGRDSKSKRKPHEYLGVDENTLDVPRSEYDNVKSFGVFGVTAAKLGSYYLNRVEQFGTITKDMWYGRTMARWLEPDKMIDKDGKVLGVPWNHSENLKQRTITNETRLRKLASMAWEQVARERGTTPADIQQRMWDFEKRMWENMGATERTGTISQGIEAGKKTLANRQFDDMVRPKSNIEREVEAYMLLNSMSPTSSQGALFQDGQRSGEILQGSTEFFDGGFAILRGFQAANFSTGIHEISHVARRWFLNRNIDPSLRVGITDKDIRRAEVWAGVGKDGIWSVESEEKFSRAFEKYIRDGKAPVSSLQGLFDDMRAWMVKIYRVLTGGALDVKISPEMKQVFDHLLTRSEVAAGNMKPIGYMGQQTLFQKAMDRIIHYGKDSEMTVLDPKFYGEGKTGAELQRKRAYPEYWEDRMSSYMGDHKREYGLGNYRFEITGNPKILVHGDEASKALWSKAGEVMSKAGQTGLDAQFTIYEQMVKRAGYDGLTGIGQNDNQAIFFTKQPVKLLGSAFDKLYQKEHVPTLREKIERKRAETNPEMQRSAPRREESYTEKRARLSLQEYMREQGIEDYEKLDRDLPAGWSFKPSVLAETQQPGTSGEPLDITPISAKTVNPTLQIGYMQPTDPTTRPPGTTELLGTAPTEEPVKLFQIAPPKKTVTAYKLFRTLASRPGEIFPLFIGKNESIPIGKWIGAEFKPTPGYSPRPGWHAGVSPEAPHLMTKQGTMPTDRVWAEVQLPDDRDWQARADQTRTGDIRDQVPEGGYYRWKRSDKQGKEWLIGGALKVVRLLSNEEAATIAAQPDVTPTDPNYIPAPKGMLHGVRYEGQVLAGTQGHSGRSTKNWVKQLGTAPDLTKVEYGYVDSDGKFYPRDAKKDILYQRTLPPEEQAINDFIKTNVTDQRTWKDRIKGLYDSFYTNFVNRWWPVEKTSPEGATYLRLSGPKGYGVATSALEAGVPVMDQEFAPGQAVQRMGEGFRTIMQPIADANMMPEFVRYSFAKRALEKGGQGIEIGINLTPAQLQSVVDRYSGQMIGNQTMEQFSQRLIQYQADVLAYYRDSGMISATLHNAMRDSNVMYIPFYRALENTGVEGIGKGSQPRGSLLKRMTGVKEGQQGPPILDPIDSIVKNTYAMFMNAEKNRALAKFVELSPELVREISTIQQDENLTPEEQVAETFSAYFTKQRDNTFTIYENGKPRTFEVDPEIGKALHALDVENVGIVEKILSVPAKLLRTGAVVSPEFIARNPVRDWFSAMVYSKYGFNPWESAKGIASIVNKDDTYHQWLIGGGAQSAFVSFDRGDLHESVKQLLAKKRLQGLITGDDYKDIVKHLVTSPLQGLRILSELSEMSTRLGLFQRALSAGASPQEAVMQSRDSTIDFGRVGAKGKAINMIIAFWNANVQGLDKMRRSLNFVDPANRPAALRTFAKATMMITLPSLLLAWANRDDPRVQELPEWQKALFWIVPIGDHIWRIPKPFELGIIFGTIPEHIMGMLTKNDPKAYAKMGQALLSSGLPGAVPTAVIPFVENWANKSLFTGRPLVPRGKEGLSPEYQYQPYTTETAKALGSIISKIPILGETGAASPAKIENFVRGWTANIGMHAMRMLDKALGVAGVKTIQVMPEKTLADIPVIKGFVSRFPGSDAQSIQDFYDSYQHFTAIDKSYKEMIKQGNATEAKALATRYAKEIGLAHSSERYAQTISNMRRMIDKIYSNNTMTPEEKRTMIDRLYLGMISIAKSFNDRQVKGAM